MFTAELDRFFIHRYSNVEEINGLIMQPTSLQQEHFILVLMKKKNFTPTTITISERTIVICM